MPCGLGGGWFQGVWGFRGAHVVAALYPMQHQGPMHGPFLASYGAPKPLTRSQPSRTIPHSTSQLLGVC